MAKVQYEFNPESWDFEFDKIRGKEVEWIDVGGGSRVYFPRVTCTEAKVVMGLVRIEVGNEKITVEAKEVTVQISVDLETKDIWDLTKDDLGQYLKVVVDGTNYYGVVSDYSEEDSWSLNKTTGKMERESQRSAFVGIQRRYSKAKIVNEYSGDVKKKEKGFPPPPPINCCHCDTSYETCTKQIFSKPNGQACCSACAYTATHKQDAWEKYTRS